ncbi:MAG: Crp/Fnr family transcriptional regulator [Gallionella sp.]|nr:Crp/Fnr family transcriptional regulator [Gallionella sp.]MDD4947352.1 Crp/Fnr family transcriptional regulator [Gallionella sp.]MDD5612829.1 Crp/Fnr family transcriptional regulator [Gallionella sp.]
MLSSDIRTRLLQQYPMLQEMPVEELEAIIAQARLVQVPAATIMFDENQPCQGFPLLLSGRLRVIKSAASGRELQLYRVVPGESCILTSSCLLGNTPYQARGITDEAVEVIMLPATVFHSLLAKNNAFRHYVFQLFTERLTDMMELVTAVAFQKLDQRLAALLVNRPSPLNVTHQALADELGSAREMVSRLLKSFASQGWVRLGREQITVTDRDALKRFATL